MARIGSRTSHDDPDDAHGSRPWVYFMIDAFFLVTQFFVITFKVKSDEVVLPQKLPPGGDDKTPAPFVAAEPVRVHVMRSNGIPAYEFMSQRVALGELQASLERAKAAGRECIVRVSYSPDVPFSDVVAVFNACSKVNIRKCGLVPLRRSEAPNG